MSDSLPPLPHPDPQVDVIRGYITGLVDALDRQGMEVLHSWLDPRDPLDATIQMRARTVVWNEEQGCIIGDFVSGRPGQRTVLSNATPLGGSVLLDPNLLAYLVKTGRTAPQVKPRSFATDVRDGLYDGLARYQDR